MNRHTINPRRRPRTRSRPRRLTRITFRAEGPGPVEIIRVRRALKACLRMYGLRAVAVVDASDVDERNDQRAAVAPSAESTPQNAS